MKASPVGVLPLIAAAAAAAFDPLRTCRQPAFHRSCRPLVEVPMVHLHGRTALRAAASSGRSSSAPTSRGTHAAGERPPDPSTLSSPARLEDSVSRLLEWFEGKSNVLCLTGAGLSTESGIPDYRGYGGSYRRGHKPMVHDQFMGSDAQRRRYWGRSMVGWREFYASEPNSGHCALADLERAGRIGVAFDDRPEYYGPDRAQDFKTSDGLNRMAVITQNVDGLHHRAGSKCVTELHGRGNVVRCMSCGYTGCRGRFHDRLEELNGDWLRDVLAEVSEGDMRADGDAAIPWEAYGDVVVPGCERCGTGFVKPDVVFFGDSVPRHRVGRCYAAVEAADGLLCVGSSLAVHSAFRFVRAAAEGGVPVAVLNVGETRAETSGMDVDKIESPAGPTLSALARVMGIDAEAAMAE